MRLVCQRRCPWRHLQLGGVVELPAGSRCSGVVVLGGEVRSSRTQRPQDDDVGLSLDGDDANVQLQLVSFLFSRRRRDGLGLSPMAATADKGKRMRPIL
jgi:hypothetical protein